MIIDQSKWGLIRVDGSDRTRFIHGMCTGNIETLAAGQWVRASMLTVKGRVKSVVDAVNRDDHLLLVCEPQLAAATLELLENHAIADDVEITRTEAELHRVWDSPAAVWTAPPVFGPLPGPAATAQEYELRRIEGGFPKFGADVSDQNFPFETPLARVIDYDKGCYLGQEPVARVHSRGSAQKALRGLIVTGDERVPVHAKVAHPERPSAGEVTSSVVSPTFGSIALAYVHKTAWEPGMAVTVADRPAKVVSLPFSDSVC